MRIIGGQHRGTQLTDVGKGDAAAHLRPTSDRVRENLFNILMGGRFGDVVREARVLDLFAGTGALGLEALSRGARQATFVENGRVGLTLLKQNIAKLRREADCAVLAVDAMVLPKTDTPANLIFMDPPYGKRLGQKALKTAKDSGWVQAGTVVVWEESTQQMPPRGFQSLDQRRYGETWINLMEAI